MKNILLLISILAVISAVAAAQERGQAVTASRTVVGIGTATAIPIFDYADVSSAGFGGHGSFDLQPWERSLAGNIQIIADLGAVSYSSGGPASK